VDVEVKVRYRNAAAPARIEPLGQETVRVRFRTPQRAVTPGQSVVFYQGDELLGGGIIQSTSRSGPSAIPSPSRTGNLRLDNSPALC
jgi:tRNA-specific 2-thiouridylase